MTTSARELVAEVGEVLDAVLQRPATAEQGGDVVRERTAEWDSLRHIELVLGLEEQFAVRFGPDEVPGLVSTVAIAAAVARHRADRC